MTGHRDSALSLLDRVVDDALDAGYQDAAEQRSPRRLDWRDTAVLAVVIGLLATFVTAAVVQVRHGAPSAARTRSELTDRVVAETAALKAADARVAALSRRVETLHAAALGGGEAQQSMAAEVADLAAQAGLAPVTGDGVEVTLDDGPADPAGDGGADLARVLDADVQLTVNGLFAAGATAVAVNGQRITALTPIRSAGSAILVGFLPLVPPYQVTAVGPDGLAADFSAGSARADLHELELSYGMHVDVSPVSDVTVPARPGQPLRYVSRGAGP